MMRSITITLLASVLTFLAGFCLGIWFGPDTKSSEPGQYMASLVSKIPGGKAMALGESENNIEVYDYPTIKWRAKPLADSPSAIAQLWTTYDWEDPEHHSGTMKYRLTMFKAQNKAQCEVQLLDRNGFKITQFDAGDFHPIPGAPDIVESRDSHQCSEQDYKRVRDYSIR
jgi:hypothetical protein